MSYIIVWQANSRDPHLQINDHYFLETYSTYEDAVEAAEEIKDGKDFSNYQIYQEVNS